MWQGNTLQKGCTVLICTQVNTCEKEKRDKDSLTGLALNQAGPRPFLSNWCLYLYGFLPLSRITTEVALFEVIYIDLFLSSQQSLLKWGLFSLMRISCEPGWPTENKFPLTRYACAYANTWGEARTASRGLRVCSFKHWRSYTCNGCGLTTSFF